MKLERMTKAELIEYCRELEKVAEHNKGVASRAVEVAESFQAAFEKEGLLKSEAPTLSEH